MKKKAFTMMEIIFVIVVIGILVVTIAPKFERDPLMQATVQVAEHIRYTQHLALVDDKYDPTDSQWFRQRWQIRFFKDLAYTNTKCPVENYSNMWSYTIFSDNPTYTRLPNIREMARNPQSKDQLLSGGYNNTLCVNNNDNKVNEQSMSTLRLKDSYGIVDMKFSGGCRSNVRYLSFDHVGRPFNSYVSSRPYELGSAGWFKLITQRCLITLCTKDCNTANINEKLSIAIEPETGYVHIL